MDREQEYATQMNALNTNIESLNLMVQQLNDQIA